jgi:hypothetical protein
MGALHLTFEAFRAEQLERFKAPAYTVGQLAAAAEIPRYRLDAAIKAGQLRAYKFGQSKNKNRHWTIERDDWIRYRWAVSNQHPAEPAEPPPPEKIIARPRRGRPPEKTQSRPTHPVRHRTAGVR